MRWGVMPFRLDFEADPEANVSRTFRCALPAGQYVAFVVLAFSSWKQNTTHKLLLALEDVLRESQQD